MVDEPKKINPEKVVFERRKFVRLSGNFIVSYREVAVIDPKSDVTQTKDISLGGILFTTDRAFSPGTILKLVLRLPNVGDPVNAKARVIDSKEIAKNLLYDTRAQFTGIEERYRDFIEKMIQSHVLKNVRKVKGKSSEK